MADTEIRDPSGKVTRIGAPKYTSREARGVWEKPGNPKLLWKIYTNQGPFTNAFNMITTADHEGLPVPAFSAIRGYKFRTASNATWIDAYILQTAAQSGEFFAMSQAGKKQVWNQWLHTLDRTKDITVLNSALRAATAASKVGLRDPQGFLEKTRREPVVFIDIHTAASSEDADEMLRQIKVYMGIN